jgi:hypothetical protein
MKKSFGGFAVTRKQTIFSIGLSDRAAYRKLDGHPLSLGSEARNGPKFEYTCQALRTACAHACPVNWANLKSSIASFYVRGC